mgnify:CR=1 FL=1|jgi:hypothetical protein|tara:strand:- start:1179 stop:1676 length:498 start_codon:yes stop_codon:yes gene_type:complete
MAGKGMMVLGSVVSAAGQMAAGAAAKNAGRYRQQVQERNAKVVEQEKEITRHKTGEDIVRFREQFEASQGTTRMALAKRGVRSDTGTGLRILLENAQKADQDIAAALYNAELGERTLDERATQMRLQGQLYAFEGRQQQRASMLSAGGSLLAGLSKAGKYGKDSA